MTQKLSLTDKLRGAVETLCRKIGIRNQSVINFIKFGMVGFLNTGVDWVVFSGLSLAGVVYLAAKTVSYLCGMLVSFTLNRSFTFNASGHKWAQFGKFFAVNAVSLGISLLLMRLFVGALGVNEMLANIIVTICVLPVSFTLNRLFVFRKKSKSEDAL